MTAQLRTRSDELLPDCPRRNRWFVSDAKKPEAQPLYRLIRPPDLARSAPFRLPRGKVELNTYLNRLEGFLPLKEGGEGMTPTSLRFAPQVPPP